jgi:thiaminase II
MLDHPFLAQLSKGTLPLPAFRHYLVQDYHFLTHFARSTALAAYKSTSLPAISAAAKIILHIETEVSLHRTLCAEYGVTDAEMEYGEEDLACVAYTRWVTDIGTREDWFALQIAMMPCLLGYGAIARRLYDDEETLRDGNAYFRWIENYVEGDYVSAVTVGRELLEGHAVRLSPERVDEMVEIFREGTRLEGLFWEMGLLHHEKNSTKNRIS